MLSVNSKIIFLSVVVVSKKDCAVEMKKYTFE